MYHDVNEALQREIPVLETVNIMFDQKVEYYSQVSVIHYIASWLYRGRDFFGNSKSGFLNLENPPSNGSEEYSPEASKFLLFVFGLEPCLGFLAVQSEHGNLFAQIWNLRRE